VVGEGKAVLDEFLMPASIDNQLQYSGGEFSPLLDARVDHPKYQSACRQLQNMIALRQGGATRRPGTIFKAKTKYQNTDVREYAARLMEFQFSPTTSFILEFGHQYVRFYSNQQQVTIASASVNAWVALTPYVVGNFVKDGGLTYYCIAAVTSAIIPSADPVSWAQQDIYEVPTIYSGRQFKGPSIYTIDIWRIIPCQINDVIYLVHPDYPPYKLERFGDTDWRFSIVNFLTPALLDENVTGVLLTPSAVTGAMTLTATAPAWAGPGTYYAVGRSVTSGGLIYTAIANHVSAAAFATDLASGFWRLETIFTAGNIGGYFEVGYIRNSAAITQALTGNGTSATIEASGACEFQTFGTWSATATLERSDDGGTTWYSVRTIISLNDHNSSIPVNVVGVALFRITASNYTASAGTPRATFTIIDSVALGLVKVTGYTNAYQVAGQVVERLAGTTATNIWSEGAWSLRRGYPQAITAFQQRLIYGGSTYEPQRIWATVVNDLENFALGDQTLATDGLAFDIAAVGRGRIQWLLGQVDLFAGFSGAEWIVNAGQGAFGGSTSPIGPTSINAGEHSSWGSAEGVPPALVGNAVLYPQRSAKTMQQMVFSVYTNKYMSDDLTALSEHMFSPGIAQISYQPQFRSQSIIWTVNKAGALCGMTYDMQAEVYGWHRHISGYNADRDTVDSFESVASIDGQNVQDDEVWVVVKRDSGRCVELINPNIWETAGAVSKGISQPDAALAIYVDSAVSILNPGTNVFSGLDHLEGQSVIGLINGNTIFGPLTVTGGAVTVDGFEPSGSDIVHVGLPIDYAVQGMRMDVDPRAGIVMGVMKALSRIYLRVFNSLGGKVQGNGTKQVPIIYKLKGTPPSQVGPLTTGQMEVVPEGTQSDDPIFIVKGNDPLPLTLLATTTRIGITGSS
jgi:hypothetical protein